MPTGYTYAVQNGEITTLRDFALTCARGMGACIMMRDEPANASIPERFEPSTWNAERLKEARSELAELRSLSEAEVERRAADEYADRLAAYEAGKARDLAERNRYQAMLAQVVKWQTGAEGIKSFMLDQLRSSINFDCKEYADDDPHFGRPKQLSGAEWLAAAVAKAARDIEYHAVEDAKEIERTEARNAWLKALRDSLPPEEGFATTSAADGEGPEPSGEQADQTQDHPQ